MSQSQRFALQVAAFVCTSALWTAGAVADDAVTAYLVDGREVTGTVDVRTDTQHLWLRRSAEQFDLASGYRWDQVLVGRAQDRTLDNPAFRAWTLARKQAGRRLAEITPAVRGEVQTVSTAVPTMIPPPVKTLIVDAELAQWDKDAQTDGLRILVYPLDAHGNIVPVDGHIEFTLAVERESSRVRPGYVKDPEFVESERMTFPVRKEQFRTGAAFYQLPFDRWHPDFELTFAHQALLHARLSIPGQGVFEASDAQVCLRQFSRFRDQLQYYSQGRYLPLENPSGDGR